MFNVNSRKAVRRLSDRSFRAEKSRNMIAVIAIALTALLFTALFTVGSGMIENLQRQTMRQAGGDGMGVFKYIDDEEYEKVKDHELIDEISYNRLMCEDVENEQLIKRHAELYYMDDTAIKLGFCEPTGGHKPQAADEIMMDTKSIKLLGMEQKVGSPVTLKLVVHGREVERDFVLSGWWEADPVFNVSIMVTSRAYMEEHADELYNSYRQDSNMTGVINSYIMFRNSFGLESKMERVITESGYSMDENDPNYIANNVNWAYVSTNFDPDLPTAAGIVSALLLIILTGYLIIYNIFQISVIRDIRFYGLLKTIGMTGRQVGLMIRRQALMLSRIGIPLGLVSGYFIGCSIVPLIMDLSYYASTNYQISANPLIFIGSAVFALVTVAVSTAKPGRIAASVSPVEAVRYTEAGGDGIKRKKRGRNRGKGVIIKRTDCGQKRGTGTDIERKDCRQSHGKGDDITGEDRGRRYGKGAGTSAMAAANLGRNKKRTVLVVCSMALSLVLFNTVYTLSLGFDMDKFLSRFTDTDYLIAHADYFNHEYSGAENSLSESMITAVEQQPGFQEGGRLYGNISDAECFREEPAKDAVSEEDGALGNGTDDQGNIFCAVYGLEDLPLNRLEVLEGEIDVEKLKTGRYILEGIELSDDGKPFWNTSHHEIGDTVTLHNYRGTGETAAENEYMTYEFKVMAKVAVKTYTNSCGVSFDYAYYLPADVYKQMTAVPGVMSFVYNVEDGEEPEMDSFLQNYTENVEPAMNYSSKETRAAEFESVRNMILIVGGALSFVIGLIGVLNFVNSMLTSIVTRRREFAMLQSIGMTTKQLNRMLMTEGLLYTAAAGAVSILLGILLSAVVSQTIAENLWFFSYRFTILPLMVTIPILLLIGLLLPWPVLRTVEKQSIVERLRETEA